MSAETIRLSGMDRTNALSDDYLHINSCGRADYRNVDYDYRTLRRNGRVDHHILYVVSGVCVASLDGEDVKLTAGDYLYYPPGMSQCYTFFRNNRCTTFWIHFTGRAAEEVAEGLELRPGVTRCEPSDRAQSLFDELVRTFRRGGPFHSSEENGLLLLILSALAHAGDERTPSGGVETVMRLMSESPDRPYSADEWAKTAGLSVGRFEHKFRETAGVSPLAYYNRLRAKRACELLSCTAMSVTEIASALGYDDPFYFSRSFKRVLGVSPAVWRKEAAKG